MSKTESNVGKRENIIFISDAHKRFYYERLKEVRKPDVYHKALCYCLGISDDAKRNINSIYDFRTDCVKTECLHKGWQTSGSARVVRMALFVKNRWIDESDRVYIIFTLEQVMEHLNCGKDKGVKILADLDSDKGIGLIERVKRRLGKPAIIYIKSFLIKRDPKSETDAETPPSAADVIRSPDLINTDYSYTDFSETNLINLSNNPPAIKQENASDDVSAGVSGKVELLAEIVGIERDTINIAGAEYPYQFVKGKLLKIGCSHT